MPIIWRKKGIRVFLPDAHLHGAREENLDEVQLSLRFWEIVLTSIEEMSFIREELVQRGLHTTGKIGLGRHIDGRHYDARLPFGL